MAKYKPSYEYYVEVDGRKFYIFKIHYINYFDGYINYLIKDKEIKSGEKSFKRII